MRSGSSPVKLPTKYYVFTFDLIKSPKGVTPRKNIIHKYKPRVTAADKQHKNTHWQVWTSYFLISTALCWVSSLSRALIQSSYSSDTSRLPGSSFRKLCSKHEVHGGETDWNDLTCQPIFVVTIWRLNVCIRAIHVYASIYIAPYVKYMVISLLI